MYDTMIGKFSLSRLLRYGYGGFLLVGILSLIEQEFVKSSIAAAGSVLAPLVVFFVGVCIFVVYRYVLGEFILYQLTHATHKILDRCMYGKGEVSSPTGYLQSLGVSWWQKRTAYTDIRRELFDKEQQERLDLAHSEIHVLYITAIEFFAAAAYLYLSINGSSRPFSITFFLVGAVLTLIAASITDIQQHRIEYRLLRYGIEFDRLVGFLRKRGYTVKSSAVSVTENHDARVDVG